MDRACWPHGFSVLTFAFNDVDENTKVHTKKVNVMIEILLSLSRSHLMAESTSRLVLVHLNTLLEVERARVLQPGKFPLAFPNLHFSNDSSYAESNAT